MAPEVDLIAIARDIAQESCYRIPVARPEWIAQRHYIFDAARAVKEMCKAANGDEEVANLVLFGAIAVEYAANFLAKISMPDSKRRSVVKNLEDIKDTLKSMEPGDLDSDDVEAYEFELIDALKYDLQVDKGTISRSIKSFLELHIGGPQEAQNFTCNWDRKPENLRQFVKENSVSLLALRDEHAVKFLDILQQAARSETTPKPDKLLYQTYLRRLSYRSMKHPSAFHLSDNVEIFHCEHIQCRHISSGGPQQSLVGGYGKVDRARWRRPGGPGTVVEVAAKALMDHDQTMLCHEAAFWYYLDPDKVVPFYGVAVVDKSPCLVSLWMDGGRICCYVEEKSDSIRLDLLRQVAEGIKYLHDLNFVHCDIKPANILIDTQQPPKALITDFGCSNAVRRTNMEFSVPAGKTPGYVNPRTKVTPWDPSNDVYAFGVTCCQVVLVGTRKDIASIPEDIEFCTRSQLSPVPEDPNGEGCMEDPLQISQRLSRKFFPIKKKSPPPFIQKIFDLVANTCIPTCKMDDVFNLLDKAGADLPIIPNVSDLSISQSKLHRVRSSYLARTSKGSRLACTPSVT